MVSFVTTSRGAQASLALLPIVGLGAFVAGWAPVHGAIGLLVLGGLVSGFLAGLLGIGGALVTIPVLYLALPRLGVAAADVAHVAVSTSLIAMLPTTLAAGFWHYRAGALHGRWFARLAPGMVAGALCGAVLASQLRGAALALAFAMQSLYYGGRLLRASPASGAAPSRLSRIAQRLPAWLVGPVMAAFCACVGMGGGSMVNPYLHAQGLDLRSSVATSSALNLCIALGGSAVFCGGASFVAAVRGPSWLAALLLGAAAFATVPIGVRLARRIESARFRVLVGAVNVAGGLSLVAHAL
jgi:uncharacterized membrane protein YfcA